MKIETGYLYHIKDEFFDIINDKKIMINHDKGHSRPSYLAIRDNELLWFIPLSTKINKYRTIINQKISKYGICKTIMIREIAGKEQAILIQNAFPTIEKYIKGKHTIDGKYVRVSSSVQRKIISNFKYLLYLKKEGVNLFFTDMDRIKEIMLKKLALNY